MNSKLKKTVAYILVGMVIIFTGVGLLGVWDVIDLHDLWRKLIYSLLVVFMSSIILLFIFSVFIKDDKKQ